MNVKVFKFGGASVRDAAQIRNVASILQRFKNEKLLVVISAMGKTTNGLEKVVNQYYLQKGDPSAELEVIKQAHFAIIRELGLDESIAAEINDLAVTIEWVLEEPVEDSYNYIYDQIVSVGELMSTKIVEAYLKKEGISSSWLDVRDVLRTDDTYREAKIDWEKTQNQIKNGCEKLLHQYDIIVTQGFIGSSQENNSTTLGREGSDYSAAIFAYCLNAESMHIWKDVPGVLTADPAQFKNVSLMDRLSYKEAVEMTYYGAKVIHPKTIKPLQNKEIPLYVRPFGDPVSIGTVISTDIGTDYPPILVIEPNQCLLHISTTDFSFVAEHHLSRLFTLLDKHRIKVNMMLNSAISFTISINYEQDKIDQFISELGSEFKVLMDKGLELITIRHYSETLLESMKSDKIVLLEEILKETARIVVKDVPLMQRIK